jgi:hypothetical protein
MAENKAVSVFKKAPYQAPDFLEPGKPINVDANPGRQRKSPAQ